MVRYLVGTLEQVGHDLAVIDGIAAVWWAMQGHTVLETPEGRAVVGKNAATGADNPEALTTTWAIAQPVTVIEDEETGEITPAAGTLWQIPSPSDDSRFYLWRDYLPEGVDVHCEEVVAEALMPQGA